MLSLKSNLTLLLAAGVIVLIGAGILAWARLAKAPVAAPCTLEAKLCPDGSAVGRFGPKCDFAACPEPATSTDSGLATQVDGLQGIEFQYQKTLATAYIQTQDWPPTVAVASSTYDCQGEPAGTSTLPVAAAERTIVGRAYCVKTSVGAAAGSVYTDYAYVTVKEGRLVTVSFTLRAPQCANYDEPNRSACETERSAFNPDSLVEPIVSSLEISGPN